MAVIVPQHPHPDHPFGQVVEQMIRETVEISASQTAGIEVKEPRLSADLVHRDLKLHEEVLSQICGNLVVFLLNIVEVIPRR
jgi:hypothetical protein